MDIEHLLEVFIYTDSEDRTWSNNCKPYIYLDEFASLEVVDTMKFGAFC